MELTNEDRDLGDGAERSAKAQTSSRGTHGDLPSLTGTYLARNLQREAPEAFALEPDSLGYETVGRQRSAGQQLYLDEHRDGDPAAVEANPRTRLQAARAWVELAELERTRAAVEAADDGITQREIGRLLNVSQTEVHRLLRRARTSGRDWGGEGAREVVLRYRAGLVSRGTMVGRLSVPSRGTYAPNPLADGYEPGTWDEIRNAYLDGLLDGDEYDELREKCQPRVPEGRRKRSVVQTPEEEVALGSGG